MCQPLRLTKKKKKKKKKVFEATMGMAGHSHFGQATPLADLGWPNHPPWASSATPWQKKKNNKKKDGFWPIGVVLPPPWTNPQICFDVSWPLGVAEPTPWATGVVRLPPDQPPLFFFFFSLFQFFFQFFNFIIFN
jgi:hypothetical protein